MALKSLLSTLYSVRRSSRVNFCSNRPWLRCATGSTVRYSERPLDVTVRITGTAAVSPALRVPGVGDLVAM